MTAACGVLDLDSGRSGYLSGYVVDDIYPDELTAELATAAGDGDTAKMDELIEQGADVNATGLDGNTLLVWAFKMENLTGFKHLLIKGTNPDLYYGLGWDEAIIADIILWKEYDYLKAILDAGANPDLLITIPASVRIL